MTWKSLMMRDIRPRILKRWWWKIELSGAICRVIGHRPANERAREAIYDLGIEAPCAHCAAAISLRGGELVGRFWDPGRSTLWFKGPSS